MRIESGQNKVARRMERRTELVVKVRGGDKNSVILMFNFINLLK